MCTVATAGVLRLDNWTSLEEIYDVIHCINERYYDYIHNNIIVIQNADKQIYTTYSIELRDAYSHLVSIFAHSESDLSLQDNKTKITRQLERYLGHLEELLYDTYSRIIGLATKSLYEKLEGDINLPKIKMEYALRITELRTVRDDMTIEQKIQRYENILDSIKRDQDKIAQNK